MQNLAKEAETYQNSKKVQKPLEQAYYLQNYNPLKLKSKGQESTFMRQGSPINQAKERKTVGKRQSEITEA